MNTIDEMIEKLERVKELQELQRDRGTNSTRKEMIDELLFSLQHETVRQLTDNAKEYV